MSTREPGVIRSVTEDSKYGSVWVHIDLGSGGCQGFGGLHLDAVDRAAFLLDLGQVFRHAPSQLEGLKCFVLRSFPDYNAGIEGLETLAGQRFTLTAWARKRWPDVPRLSPLERERSSLEAERSSHLRVAEDIYKRLGRLDTLYVDWERS